MEQGDQSLIRDQTGQLQKMEHFEDDNFLLDDKGLFADLADDLDFSVCEGAESLPSTESAFPRFSEIQKSVETLRKALPDLFNDETVDFLFQSIVSSCSEESTGSQARLELQGGQLRGNPLMAKLNQTKRSCRTGLGTSSVKFQSPAWQEQQSPAWQEELPMPALPPRLSLYSYKDPSFQASKRQPKPARQDRLEMVASMTECTQGKRRYTRHPPNVPRSKMQKEALRVRHERLDSVWSREHEAILLERYRAGQKFSIIKDAFQLEFPEQAEIYCIETIRCKFYKIVRTAIRELQKHMENIGQKKLPQLVPLTDEMIKTVMYYAPAMPARLLLIEIYTRQECHYALIRSAIEALNLLFEFKSR